MVLTRQLPEIEQRAITELDAIDLYVANTQQVWRLVQELAHDPTVPGVWLERVFPPNTLIPVAEGGDSRHDLVLLSAKAGEYAARYLAETSFQQTLAVFEAFLSDLLIAWLTAYPASLTKRQFEFGLLIGAADLTDATGRVIAAEVGGLLYKSLDEQFKYLQSRTGIDPPNDQQLAALSEAKATRNVLVHNRGVANAQYLSLAGGKARHKIGERVEVPEPYRRQVWALVRQLVTDLTDAALAQLAPDLPPPPPAG